MVADRTKQNGGVLIVSFVDALVLAFLGGWLNSYLYRKYLRKHNRGWIFWFAVIWLAVLIVVDALIYVNIINIMDILGMECPKGVDPGKYWMFNPIVVFVFNLEPILPGNGVVWDIYALMFFVSYIWWFTIGQNLGRFMYGRLEYERGAWFLLRSTKMIKKSKDKLEKKKS